MYLIIHDSSELEVFRLAEALQRHIEAREDVFSDSTATWFWDDTPDGIIHGVKFQFPHIDPSHALEIVTEMWRAWLRCNPGREAHVTSS